MTMSDYRYGYTWIYVTIIFCAVFLFFFFSSRRRHTRLQGDWSSDVCSSDLRLARSQREHHNEQERQCEAHVVLRRVRGLRRAAPSSTVTLGDAKSTGSPRQP